MDLMRTNGTVILKIYTQGLQWQSGYRALPFTSQVMGFILTNSWNQSSCKKSISQHSTESRGFPLGSSNRESWQGGRYCIWPTAIGSRCCGDPARVHGKANK